MPDDTPIDKLYGEARAVTQLLEKGAEVSLQVAAGDNFRKILLLAAASYFEYRICNSVLEFVRERSGGSMLVESFVQNKAIARQYHTWFKWDDRNANQFFGLFGSKFRAEMIEKVKASEGLRGSIQAFLEIGNERNRMIHQDYATFSLEKTLEEIYSLYGVAMTFVEQLPELLRDSERP